MGAADATPQEKSVTRTRAVALLALLILAGLVYITQPGSWLFGRNSTQDLPGIQATETTSPKAAQSSVDQPPESLRKTKSDLNAAASWTLKPEVQLQTRAERWRLAKSAPLLDQSVLSLVNDADIETPMFLAYLTGLCGKSVSFTAKDPLQSVINPTGMTYSDVLRSFNKTFSRQLTEETISKAVALKEEFALRCGKAIDMTFAGDGIRNAAQKSRAAGGALILSPTNSLSFESEGAAARITALDKVLHDSSLASIWLSQRFSLFKDAAESAGYFQGLNYQEELSVAWTVICNFGGDCNDNGITRVDACLTSHLCAGSSVAESVAGAIGADRVAIVAARANKLALDLAASGANFFKPLPKATK
jgi:hypothetical protein